MKHEVNNTALQCWGGPSFLILRKKGTLTCNICVRFLCD